MRFYIYRTKALIFSFVFIAVLQSCYKEPNYELKPNISFNSISKDIRLDQFSGAKIDSIIVTLNFTDGDGDLGYNTEEIGKDVKRTDYNYVVKTFRKNKGVFTSFEPQESLSGFFPRLSFDKKPGPIEGKLSYRIKIETAFWPFKKDTVKFEVYIKDRAGNRSNTAESKPIIINEF
jgi:hypothetical protein